MPIGTTIGGTTQALIGPTAAADVGAELRADVSDCGVDAAFHAAAQGVFS